MKRLKKDSLFKGTFILSLSLIFTKVIGLIYLIPYYDIIGGEENMALFAYSYNYYIILLEISSAGIPLTMAKLISKYNGEGNYSKSKIINKVGSTILLITGLLGFLFFFCFSDFLANLTISSEGISRYTVSDLSLVIKTLSLAIPFVMISSGFRGLFQGHEIMMPSALSQFIEQLVRVLAMLIGTYFVMKITNGNIVYANASSTFSTFLGAFFAVVILLYYYKKYGKKLDFNKKQDTYNTYNTFSIVKEILLVSIPFVIVSSFFAILTLIDQNTIAESMYVLGENFNSASEFAKRGEKEFVLYSQYINKIVMIAVSLAPAFTGAFLPAVTRLYAEKKISAVSEQLNKVLLALLMFVIPALAGMYALIEPLSNIFFRPSIKSYELMKGYIILALLYSIYGILGIIIQAIDKQRINVIVIAIGIVFKLSFNQIFIYKFETIGAIYCSILTYLLLIILSFIVIHYNISVKFKYLIINLFKIIFSSFIMFIVVIALYESLISNFNIFVKFDSLIIISVLGFIGVIVYFLTLSSTKFLVYLFGRNINIKNFFRR